jgi:hypothetical protein
VPAGFAAPTGTVTFTLPPVSIFAPPVPLGTAPLTSGTGRSPSLRWPWGPRPSGRNTAATAPGMHRAGRPP